MVLILSVFSSHINILDINMHMILFCIAPIFKVKIFMDCAILFLLIEVILIDLATPYMLILYVVLRLCSIIIINICGI